MLKSHLFLYNFSFVASSRNSAVSYICIYIVTLHFHMLQLILLILFSFTFCIYLFIALSVYMFYFVCFFILTMGPIVNLSMTE